jgi:4-amino-4-deoxy-L-arabinose transferase-like glycosyltransferase
MLGAALLHAACFNNQKFFGSFFQKRTSFLALRLSRQRWKLLLLALTLLRLAVAATVPLSADEAYYWVWSRHLAGGYLDHPPMVALWIRAGTELLGDTALGVRLLGPWAALAGSLLIARAAEDFWPGRRAGLAAAALLNATLMLNAGAVIMTPDTPLLLFWTAALAALARLLRTGNGTWWLAVGLACGLAFDSKYTAALLGGAILLWVLAVPQARRWLARWEFWAAGVLAIGCMAPVLLWNAAHGWASFAKQGGRAADWQPAQALRFVGELIGGQVGLVTPGVFAVGCAGVWQAARASRHRVPALMQTALTQTTLTQTAWPLLASVTILPALVFLEHALGGRVQANWPSVIVPGAVLAAAGAGVPYWRPACLVGALMSAAVFVQASLAPFALPRALDFTLIRLAGWSDLAGEVYVAAAEQHADYVAADEYGLACELAFRLHQPVVGVEPRWRLFDLPPAALAGETGLLVRSLRDAGPPDPRVWAGATLVGTAVRGRHGVEAERYGLYRVTWRGSGPAVRLPRPNRLILGKG